MLRIICIVFMFCWSLVVSAQDACKNCTAQTESKNSNALVYDLSKFKQVKAASHCVMPLPIGGSVGSLGTLNPFMHTYLKVDNRTYGMPFTIDRTYFGGDAVILTPDPFEASHSTSKCEPVYISTETNEEKFMTNLRCISEKLSVSERVFIGINSIIAEREYAYLDYHAFEHNCESAVKFILDCAGGQIAMNPNLGVGGEYSQQQPAKLIRDEGYDVAPYFDSLTRDLNALEANILESKGDKEKIKSLLVDFQHSHFPRKGASEAKFFRQLKTATSWLEGWSGDEPNTVIQTFSDLKWYLRWYSKDEIKRRRVDQVTYAEVCAWAKSQCE